MPKVALTLEQKRLAEAEKRYRAQDRLVRDELRNRIGRGGNKITNNEIAERTGLTSPTIKKVIDTPDAYLKVLRSVCYAAGIELVIDIKAPPP